MVVDLPPLVPVEVPDLDVGVGREEVQLAHEENNVVDESVTHHPLSQS